MACAFSKDEAIQVLAKKDAIAERVKKDKVVSKAPTKKAEWSFAADNGVDENVDVKGADETGIIRNATALGR